MHCSAACPGGAPLARLKRGTALPHAGGPPLFPWTTTRRTATRWRAVSERTNLFGAPAAGHVRLTVHQPLSCSCCWSCLLHRSQQTLAAPCSPLCAVLEDFQVVLVLCFSVLFSAVGLACTVAGLQSPLAQAWLAELRRCCAPHPCSVTSCESAARRRPPPRPACPPAAPPLPPQPAVLCQPAAMPRASTEAQRGRRSWCRRCRAARRRGRGRRRSGSCWKGWT